MIADVVLSVLGVVCVVIASWWDVKTREVPDWLSYGLLFAAGGVRVLYALLFGAWSYLGWGVVGLGVMWVVGQVLYRARQWGGGDAKLMMALGMVFGTRPFYVSESIVPFLGVLVVNILMMGAVYGVIYAGWLAWRHKKAFAKKFVELNRDRTYRIVKGAVLGVVVMLFFAVNALSEDLRVRVWYNFALLPLLVFPYVMVFVKAVEQGCLYKQVPVRMLTPGDWVEEDVVKSGKVIYKKKRYGIEKEDILALQKARIKTVLVKEGIPFVPPFLFGLIVSLVSGKIVFVF